MPITKPARIFDGNRDWSGLVSYGESRSPGRTFSLRLAGFVGVNIKCQGVGEQAEEVVDAGNTASWRRSTVSCLRTSSEVATGRLAKFSGQTRIVSWWTVSGGRQCAVRASRRART
jgi:hypothetical protein